MVLLDWEEMWREEKRGWISPFPSSNILERESEAFWRKKKIKKKIFAEKIMNCHSSPQNFAEETARFDIEKANDS